MAGAGSAAEPLATKQENHYDTQSLPFLSDLNPGPCLEESVQEGRPRGTGSGPVRELPTITQHAAWRKSALGGPTTGFPCTDEERGARVPAHWPVLYDQHHENLTLPPKDHQDPCRILLSQERTHAQPRGLTSPGAVERLPRADDTLSCHLLPKYSPATQLC